MKSYGNPSNPSNSPANTGSASTLEQEMAENNGSEGNKHLPYSKAATILAYFREDISIAYYDIDMKFHAQDVAYIPPEWVDTLVRRGSIRVVHDSVNEVKSSGGA